MTMVETVARVICEHAHLNAYPEPGVWRRGEIALKVDAYWRAWIPAARAAIAATRKPTKSMLEAAMGGRDGTLPVAVAEHVWSVMVEAAIDESLGQDGAQD